MSVAPAPGDVYNNPPIPADFAGMGVTPGILGTCFAVTTGPDRNIYWVYDDMKSTSTAIQVPVSRGVCFETRDSIALSQRPTGQTDICSTCRHILTRHMTTSCFLRPCSQLPNHTCTNHNSTGLKCHSSSWYRCCLVHRRSHRCWCRCCCFCGCCLCSFSQYTIHATQPRRL